MEQFSQSAPLFESRLRSLKRIHQGKVRDIYDVDADHLLIVTTDRLSAFDVVLPDPIPHKGQVLTQISLFWFAKTRHMVANHVSDLRMEDVIVDPEERAQLIGRTMVVKKLTALPIEAVVRRADACLYGAKHHGRNLVINQNDARMAALETSAA